jgi:MFS family permease
MELASESFIKHSNDDDKRSVVTLMACLVVSQMTYMNVAAMVPTYVASHFPDVSSFQVGMLFAFYPVMYLIACPFVGIYLARFGRKRSLVTGMTLMTIATFVFGIAAWSSSTWVYFTLSAVARGF